VNLYLLGFMRDVPFAAVHRLLPWGMLGLTLNVVTGMMFFTGVPMQYLENPTFHWKVFFLFLVGLNYLYLTVFERPSRVPAPTVSPWRSWLGGGGSRRPSRGARRSPTRRSRSRRSSRGSR